MKAKERFWNIPNTLSLSRLLAFPFVLFCTFSGYERAFTFLIIASLISDFLDGIIARVFNQQTKIGARLDSTADIGMFTNAFIGIIVFKWNDIQTHFWPLALFFSLIIAMNLFALIKFKRVSSMHLYSFKTTGYIQGSFFMVLFLWKFMLVYYYVAMIWGILACIEAIILMLYLKESRSNAKGLYWVLKEKN